MAAPVSSNLIMGRLSFVHARGKEAVKQYRRNRRRKRWLMGLEGDRGSRMRSTRLYGKLG